MGEVTLTKERVFSTSVIGERRVFDNRNEHSNLNARSISILYSIMRAMNNIQTSNFLNAWTTRIFSHRQQNQRIIFFVQKTLRIVNKR